MSEPRREAPPNLRGVWIAYYYDWSGFVVFRDELRCLRHAVTNSMEVVFCPFGQNPRDVVRDAMKPATSREENQHDQH